FGLLLVIFGLVRSGRGAAAPFAVGAYILGAYFFTSSTSFANPAVTIARTLSDTFTGIAPSSVLPFVIARDRPVHWCCARRRDGPRAVAWHRRCRARRRCPARIGCECTGGGTCLNQRANNACSSCARTIRRAVRWPKACCGISVVTASSRFPPAPR